MHRKKTETEHKICINCCAVWADFLASQLADRRELRDIGDDRLDVDLVESPLIIYLGVHGSQFDKILFIVLLYICLLQAHLCMQFMPSSN